MSFFTSTCVVMPASVAGVVRELFLLQRTTSIKEFYPLREVVGRPTHILLELGSM